jgi:hypothetical protein
VPHVRTSVHGPNMNSSNAFGKRARALDGLRPSFSAHVRPRERGAPIEIAAELAVVLAIVVGYATSP